MIRLVLFLVVIVLVNAGQASAQKVSSVVIAKRPSLTCPQTALGDVDLNARYMATWERYNKLIEEAGRKLRDEIEAQTKSATGAGNLDLALFWKAMAKEFEQKGELRWDEASLKKGWDERFGNSPYPSRFMVAVKKASEAFASATSDLERGYSDLVAEFTKAEKLEEALKVRGELKELLAGSSPAPKPEPEPKPAPEKAKPPTYLSSLTATAKRLQNGWFEVGSVWGQPIVQGEMRGDHSIFLHAKPDSFTSVTYQIVPGMDFLEAGVVVPKVKGEQGNPATPLTFEVWGDGRLLWRSQPVGVMNQMQKCRVGIKGVTTLDLRVVCPGRDNWGVAVWFEPRLVSSR